MTDSLAVARGEARVGVLLVNLGTPASPRVRDVRRYLREFLGDPRVLDVHPLTRALLLHGVILPFRPRASAAAYAKVWTDGGSPLLVHSRALAEAVAKTLGDAYPVELAMRYGSPSIARGLERLEAAAAHRIVVLPLFPQYASASTGSVLERVYRLASTRWNAPALRVVPPFYAQPRFIRALATVAKPEIQSFRPDHVLMSYHGLPERQLRRSAGPDSPCLGSPVCCDALSVPNRNCYRAQCFATSRALAEALELSPEAWGVSFQSRLGRTPWIRPYTDRLLAELAARGVRRLAVLCPSFVADCLETVEEIGIRARQQWRDLGADEFRLVPCLNAHPLWVETVSAWVRANAEPTGV